MESRPSLPSDDLKVFSEKHGIERLSFFGSILREDFSEKSDVDILVEFKEGRTPGFFGLFEIEEELSALFGGWKVDLRTPEDLSRYFREKVLKDAEIIYAGR
jgi:uncharacterized protein